MDIYYGPKMGDFLRASTGQHDQQIVVDEHHSRTSWLHFYYLDPQPQFVVPAFKTLAQHPHNAAGMESLSMVTRFAKHFAEADLNDLGAWVSHLYNHYNKMATRSGLSADELNAWGERRPGVWNTPEEEAGAAITCMVQALHYAATPDTERLLDEIQRHQTGEYEDHIVLLRYPTLFSALRPGPDAGLP